MSTILTNGLKLPDKGSIDWYSDMQNNYTILDGAVGTIADHTAQIAGKAPVAHTHTKSDVTDLFNSANTWSANNTFLAGVLTNIIETKPGETGILLRATDQTWENGARIFLYSNTHTGQTNGSIYIDVDHGDGNNTKTGLSLVPGAFYPAGGGTDGVSLGISTNKWKTFNGINPGALSLPNMGTTADVNYFDFISTITHLDGTDNFYTPTVDGWMTVIIAGTALSLFEDASSSTNHNQGSGISAAPVNGYCLATIPVHKGKRVKIEATGTSIYMAQVRPCLGNV